MKKWPTGDDEPINPRTTALASISLFLAYALGAKLGNLLSFKPSSFSAFWPPSGIYLAWLLLAKPRTWPFLIAAGIAGNVCTDLANGRLLATSLGFSLGNSLEATAGAWACLLILGRPPTLGKSRDIITLCVVGCLVAVPLSASIGSAVVAFALGMGSYWPTWLTWWTGDVLGILIFTPLCIFASEALRGRGASGKADAPSGGLRQRILACLFILVSTAACLFVFLPISSTFPKAFIILPLVAWAAIEFGPGASIIFCFLLSVLAIGGSSLGRGAFALSVPDPRSLVFSLQLFLGTTAFMGLLLAAGRAQRAEDLRALEASGAELRRALDERLVLFRELEHRVKNNLEVVHSLLSLQCRELANDEARRPLIEAQTRIRSMSLIYRRLYSGDATGSIQIGTYAGDLAREIVAAYAVDGIRVEVRDRSEGLSIDLKEAVPIGLILNELITNALKYAVSPGEPGLVAVEMERTGSGVTIAVSDDGPGLPPGFSPMATGGTGFQLVKLLAEQLRARLEAGRSDSGGARIGLSIPIPEAQLEPRWMSAEQRL